MLMLCVHDMRSPSDMGQWYALQAKVLAQFIACHWDVSQWQFVPFVKNWLRGAQLRVRELRAPGGAGLRGARGLGAASLVRTECCDGFPRHMCGDARTVPISEWRALA